jgi:hypothetical protein
MLTLRINLTALGGLEGGALAKLGELSKGWDRGASAIRCFPEPLLGEKFTLAIFISFKKTISSSETAYSASGV